MGGKPPKPPTRPAAPKAVGACPHEGPGGLGPAPTMILGVEGPRPRLWGCAGITPQGPRRWGPATTKTVGVWELAPKEIRRSGE
ncbi:hypothetical protein GCM10009753_42480 [Streptantibioticus ferralitis]